MTLRIGVSLKIGKRVDYFFVNSSAVERKPEPHFSFYFSVLAIYDDNKFGRISASYFYSE